MSDLPPVEPLRGQRVVLEPLGEPHVDDLAHAADADRTTYAWTSVPAGRQAMARSVRELVDAADTIPFAQVVGGRACGVTRFLSLRGLPEAALPYAVEIGGTWLAASAQRSGVNREAKLLLMTHAFEVWGVGRVDFKTDARNERSRAALAGIGAVYEGVLRSWQPSHAAGEQGRLRDTAMFSVVAAEWPAVKEQLAPRSGR